MHNRLVLELHAVELHRALLELRVAEHQRDLHPQLGQVIQTNYHLVLALQRDHQQRVLEHRMLEPHLQQINRKTW